MQANQLLSFGPYRLDPHTGQLWRGKQEVKLTPKAAAVLCYLLDAGRAGRDQGRTLCRGLVRHGRQ